MGIMAGSGREQSNIPLEERLANKKLRTPGKSLHFFNYEKRQEDQYVELPPYSGPTTTEIIEQTPSVKPTIREKLWQYRGGAAIVAAPGDVIPKIYGTTIVQGRVIWASDIYLDENNRPRIDIAYGLCEGTVTSMLKIYGGNDKQLLYGTTTLEGAANGVKYWKKVKLVNGAADQDQVPIIKSHEGANNTPYYRGLAYAVFKGLKLYKFDKSAPDLWFVIGRQLDSQEEEDEYGDEPTFYNPLSAYAVTSIAGNFDDAPDKLYVSSSGQNVYEVTLSTNTWTQISNTAQVGTNVKRFNTLSWFKGSLYLHNPQGLYKWSGSGQTWTKIWGQVGAASLAGSIGAGDNEIIFYSNYPVGGIYEIYSYDGVGSVTGTGFGDLGNYRNGAYATIDENGERYMMMYKTINDSRVMYYEPGAGSWADGSMISNNFINCKSYPVEAGYYFCASYSQSPTFDMYWQKFEWVQYPAVPTNESTLVYNDTAYRVTDIEKFSDRWHMTRSVIGGTQELYRRETNGTITTMPIPSAAGPYYTHMLQKIGNRLFVGCSRGFWEAGDAP